MRDGGGESVHSEHERWSTSAIAGWTPGEDSELELSYDRSNAEAAYDDRRMDGTDFDRTSYRLSGAQDNLTGWLTRIEANFYYNNIDHVMDNFRLRDPGMMTMARVLERTTMGGRVSADIDLFSRTDIHAGLDFSTNEHADSGPIMEMGSPWLAPIFGAPRLRRRAEFSDMGLFADMERQVGDNSWLTLGVRGDYHEAEALLADYGGAPRVKPTTAPSGAALAATKWRCRIYPSIFMRGWGAPSARRISGSVTGTSASATRPLPRWIPASR